MNKIFIFLETLDLKKKSKLIRFLFAPIMIILEFITYKYYWKIILQELIETDQLMDFLLKNEFGLSKGRLIKKDLYDDNEFYTSKTDKEAKELMKKEFVDKLVILIEKFCKINIENYLTLIVKTNTKITQQNNDVFQNKIYTVYLQYCRYYRIMELIKINIIWILLNLSLLILLLIFVL